MKKVTKTNVIFTTVILVYIIMIFGIRLIPDRFLTYNVMLVVPELVILFTAAAAAKILNVETLKESKFNCVSAGTCVKSVILAFLSMPAVGVISAVTSNISGNAASNAISKVMNNPLWLNLILLALLPAIVEEYVFRGLIFLGYKKRNPFRAVILSAILFGLMHMNINQFSYAFVLGIVLALLVYATGSIIPGIIVHFTINGYSVVMSYVADRLAEAARVGDTADGSQPAGGYIFTYVFLIVVLILTAYLAVRLFLNICKNNRSINSVISIFKKDRINTYADEGRFIDGYLVLGIVVCISFIIYFDFIL